MNSFEIEYLQEDKTKLTKPKTYKGLTAIEWLYFICVASLSGAVAGGLFALWIFIIKVKNYG